MHDSFDYESTAQMGMDSDISARIRADIISGELVFGARITIANLANRYGVSQMPVRVALSQLQGEGLVEMTPSGRASVRAVDRKFVNNIFEIRRSLEALIVKSAAEQISDEQLSRLEKIEDELERMVDRKDYAGAHKLNRAFHQVIAEAANNPDVVVLLDRHMLLLTAWWQGLQYGPERFAGVVSDHRFLIKAFRLRDPDSAVMIIHSHVTKGKLVMLDHFPQSPEPPMMRLPGRRRRGSPVNTGNGS